MPGSMVMAFRNWSPAMLVGFIVFIALYFFWTEHVGSYDNFLTRTIEWVSDHPVIFILLLVFVIFAVVFFVGPEKILSIFAKHLK